MTSGDVKAVIEEVRRLTKLVPSPQDELRVKRRLAEQKHKRQVAKKKRQRAARKIGYERARNKHTKRGT